MKESRRERSRERERSKSKEEPDWKMPRLSKADFPHHKKKLVMTDYPSYLTEEEIKNYFHTILTSFEKDEKQSKAKAKSQLPFKLEIFEEGRYCVLEFFDRDAIETVLSLDGTIWNGATIKIQRVKRFISYYNDQMEEEEFDRKHNKEKSKFQTRMGYQPPKNQPSENKIYMGGIPPTMSDSKVREMCEAFGLLKSFNLVKDPANPDNNKGFCFFEYIDDKVTDKAIKSLNNFEIGDRKLKVQKASLGQKNLSPQPLVGYQKYVPKDMQFSFPLFTMTPSRVVQFMNFVDPIEMTTDQEIIDIKEDFLTECEKFGEVLGVEIPKPDMELKVAEIGIGKIFIKFSHIIAAKQARYRIAGRKYNNRTVVGAFYPEYYFDSKQFNII